MWDWHDGPDGWGWFWMVLMMALVWLPLLLAAAWLMMGFGARGWRSSDDRQPDDVDARELARRSYALGEIDRDRFLEMIADLDRSERPRAI